MGTFTGDGQRFVGNDARVAKATFGSTPIVGDGIVLLPEGIYMVLAVGGTTAFPSPAGLGDVMEKGYIWTEDAGTFVPAVGDILIDLTLTDLCDISSFTMPFTKEQIDVSTLCDLIKKYRQGRSDMQGSITGIFTAGISDASDGFLRQFIDVVRQDQEISYDIFKQQDDILVGFFYINRNTALADRMVIISPFILNTYGLGGEPDAGQTFDGSFNFTNLSYVDATYSVPMKTAFYRLAQP